MQHRRQHSMTSILMRTGRWPSSICICGGTIRAIREAERTISLDPNLAIGHEVLASALTYSGRPEEALESFDRAMALDPYYPDLWLHLKGMAMFQLGRYDEAIGLLKQRLIRNPDTDISRELLAACYGHQGRNDRGTRRMAGGVPCQSGLFSGVPPDCAALQEPGRFRKDRGRAAQGRCRFPSQSRSSWIPPFVGMTGR